MTRVTRYTDPSPAALNLLIKQLHENGKKNINFFNNACFVIFLTMLVFIIFAPTHPTPPIPLFVSWDLYLCLWLLLLPTFLFFCIMGHSAEEYLKDIELIKYQVDNQPTN